MGISRRVSVAGACARRVVIALGWLVMACAMAGCTPENLPTRPSAEPNTPSVDLSVAFHLDPAGTQVVTPPQTLTYRVVVDQKGVLNAGVEFEAVNVPPELTATLNAARISETARETQLVVQVASGTRPGDYQFTLRARLTVAGQGGPVWTPAPVPIRVSSGESGFQLLCAGELAIPRGDARTLTCRTIRDPGFTAIIDLSFTNRPGYIMMYPETASVGPDVGGFAFTVVRSLDATTPAFFDLVGQGRSGGLTRQSTTRLHFP